MEHEVRIIMIWDIEIEAEDPDVAIDKAYDMADTIRRRDEPDDVEVELV